MSDTNSAQSPLRVAIVGAGPSGFYSAERVLSAFEHAQVDIFDRLPTPYGLVRGGVAPDHPKIKSVTRVYDKTASREGFRFFGNVEIGRDLDVEDLERHYHAIIYTFGAEADRELGIPGEDLPGSHSATAFVGWYNAHPDFSAHDFELENVKRAVVIGNGNVAVDVARMLALSPSELRETDTADHAIECFDRSSLEEVVVLGRRGPAQAAFTNPELRELGELADADVIVDPADLELDRASRDWVDSDEADPTAKRNIEILEDFAGRRPAGKPKRVILKFLRSPAEIQGDGRVERIVLSRNELRSEDGRIRASDTGERETLDCELVLRSVGYRGIPLPGVPFDESRGTIVNESGRVLKSPGGEQMLGHYTAGWIKRGPSGVIGTNKKCAQETVSGLAEDAESGRLLEPEAAEPDAVDRLLGDRGVRYVTFGGWTEIDRAETERGQPHGRPRVKFVDIDEMLKAAGHDVEASMAAGDSGRD